MRIETEVATLPRSCMGEYADSDHGQFGLANSVQVLACFKKLHQTSERVFKEDLITAQAARDKINLEFRKHKDITDEAKIEELLKVGFEAEQALRETIIQAKLTDHGSYELKITPDTKLEDNFLFKPGSDIPVGRKKKTKCDDPSP